MSDGDQFIDYYDVLGVNPNCSARDLEAAYHLLAKKYHPDHSDRPDVAKFTEAIEAFRALDSDSKRTAYDLVYAHATGFVFSSPEESHVDEQSAVSDADAHEKILLLLYKRRREQAQDAGVGRYYVKEILDCSEELFEFHLWYLREKGFIQTTEQGTLAITIEGVDHVISKSRSTLREKLLLTQSVQNQGKEMP